MAAVGAGRYHEFYEPLIVRLHPFRQQILRCYRENYHRIRSYERHFATGNAVYNFQLVGGRAVSERDLTRNIYNSQQNAFRVNASCGFILFNNANNTCRYFHPSWVNNAIYENTPYINGRQDWNEVAIRLSSGEVLMDAASPRDNSSEIVVWVTQLYVWTWRVQNQILMQ